MVIAAEGERFAHEIRTALPQGVVEPLDVGRLTGLLGNRPMPFRRQDTGVGVPVITVADCPFTIRGWQGMPQFPTGLGAAIAKGEPNNATRLAF